MTLPACDHTLGIEGDVGIEGRTRAHTGLVAHGDMRIEARAVANDGVLAHADELCDIDVLSYLGALGDACQRRDARLGFRGLLLLVEVQQLGEGKIGVLHLDERTRHLVLRHKVLVDNGSRRLGRINVLGIFRIGEKSEPARRTFFNFTDGGNLQRCITNNICIKQLCNLCDGIFHIFKLDGKNNIILRKMPPKTILELKIIN